MNNPPKILVIIGTRPEAIKLAPVVLALQDQGSAVACKVVCTGQHREMAVQALDVFNIEVDVQLDTMLPGQSLGQLSAKLFEALDKLFHVEQPDYVVVQGDTTSAMVAAMVAFYRGIKVAHVEAGLRTYDRHAPFPEEINRIFIGHLADLHFPPTRLAKENLLLQGVPEDKITVTGNTVVDAVQWMRAKVLDVSEHTLPAWIPDFIKGKRLVLVTSHRRESFGEGISNICNSILEIVRSNDDVVVIYPVHMNPKVKEPVHELLAGEAKVALLEPLSYLDLMYLVEKSYFVMTDSGGLQEEVPSFGKPILILRETTERPEAIEAGCARLVGTNYESIVSNAKEILNNSDCYKSMAHIENPFGDGHASQRIVEQLLAHEFAENAGKAS